MNWIPKEQSTSKQPTEKQIMQDYFRRHRPRVLPAARSISPVEERPSSAQSQRSLDKSPAPYQSHFGRELSMAKSPKSSRRSRSEDPETLSDSLGRMNVKRLAQTVKMPQKHISTDLVHLELIKRIFVYQPRPPTPEAPPENVLLNEAERGDYIDYQDVEPNGFEFSDR